MKFSPLGKILSLCVAFLATQFPFAAFAQGVESIPVSTNFQGHKDSIRHVQFSRDGKFVFSTSINDAAKWSWPDGKIVKRFPDGDPSGFFIDEGRNLLQFFGGSAYNSKTGTPQNRKKIKGFGYLYTPHKLHRRGKLDIYTQIVGTKGKVGLIEANKLKLLGVIKIPFIDGLRAVISDNMQKMIWSDVHGGLFGWNLKTKRATPDLFGHRNTVNCLFVSPDGKTAISCSDDGIVNWDLETGQETKRISLAATVFKEKNMAASYANNIHAISPNFRLAVIGYSQPFLYDLQNETVIKKLNVNIGSIASVAFSPSGNDLVIGDSDGNMIGFSRGISGGTE